MFYDNLRNITICSIINIIFILFIIIVSFYLIRRLNRIEIKKNVETFVSKSVSRGSSIRPVVNINLDSLNGSINNLANKLESIDRKLDYMTGFKSFEGKAKKVNNSKKNRYP